MRKDDSIRLRHMLDAVRASVSFIKEDSRETLERDRKLEFALVKSIEIIGEAAVRISEETRQSLSRIP
jgi:uncharacterized protein with HEPN domain